LAGPVAKPTQETAKIKDWRIAFDVRLNLKTMKDQDVPKFIQDALKNPSGYNILKLVVDFSNVDLSKYDESRSLIDLPTDRAKNDFVTSIGLYLKAPAGILHSAIYYLPILKKTIPDHSLGRSIIPTALSFQNLPFVVSPSDKGTKNNDNNMLIYLQMTEGRDLPRDLLPFPTANWIVPPASADPNEKYDGTVGLSERAFLPLLSFFNQYSTWIAESVGKSSGGNPPVIKGHCGYLDSELPAEGIPWVYDAKNSTPDVRKYVYKQRSTTKPSADLPLAFQEGLTQNKLEIPVGLDANGKCVIKLEGKTDVVTAIAGFGSAIQSGTWSGELTLDSSSHSNFKINLNVAPKNVTETIFGDDIQSVVQPFKKSLEESLGKLNSDDFKTQLTQLLTGTWKFIFAPNGGFVVNEAAFNREGDLLIKITVKS